MNHKQVTEILHKIERSIDVNAYWIDGVQVWPILRRDIWIYLLSLDNVSNFPLCEYIELPRKGKSNTSLDRPEKPREELALTRSLTHELSQVLTSADILFWSRKEDHTEVFVDGVVDRIIDPMIWFAREEGLATLKLSRSDGVNWNNIKQIEPGVVVSLDQLHDSRVLMPFAGSAEDLFDFIKKVIPALSVTHAQIVSAVRRLNSRADFFDIVLDIVKPRLVMLGVYYSADAMALIHACRRRGIPVVDIQHGKQGLYHAMYGGWPVLPSKGYSVLPDVFWTWGQESADVIRAGFPGKSIRPRTVVGGNLWLARWKAHSSQFTCLPEVQNLFGKMDGYRRSVLVSLQPLSEPLPEYLLEAMRQAPQDWFWLVRTHPHQRKYIAELEAGIKAAGVKSYDINLASNAPLYPLLSRVDVHMTCWSSVAYEALSLGKPTVLIHPVAKKLYSNYINRNLFSYADTAAALLKALTELSDKPLPPEISPYIETNEDKARKALKLCFKSSLNWLRLWSILRRRTDMFLASSRLMCHDGR